MRGNGGQSLSCPTFFLSFCIDDLNTLAIRRECKTVPKSKLPAIMFPPSLNMSSGGQSDHSVQQPLLSLFLFSSSVCQKENDTSIFQLLFCIQRGASWVSEANPFFSSSLIDRESSSSLLTH